MNLRTTNFLNIFNNSFGKSYLKTSSYLNKLSDGNESDSEKWLKYVSDSEDFKNGNISAFEDEEGNLIRPTGKLSYSTALRKLKIKTNFERKNRFLDRISISVKGGNGGNGMISFANLFANEFAGPDGGDGGNGGHIILRARNQIKSLANLKKNYRGNDGEKGMSCSMIGKKGEHIFVDVPVGTLVKSSSPAFQIKNSKDLNILNATRILADLDEDGSMFLAAKGGTGGKGNEFFLSNENRHPRIAEAGAQGESFKYLLEMKIIAHIGFVGFPNVGKSTLLRAITRAKPLVANHEFTTKKPNLGIIDYDDYNQIAVADLPGLIEGAHLNKGLGVSFLRHLERCVCLLFVIDLSKNNCIHQFETLKRELDFYKKNLSKRPHAIIGNKSDIEESSKNLETLRAYLKEHTPENEVPIPVIPCSAKYGKNLKELLNHVKALYDLYNKPDFDEEGFEW